MCLRSSATDSVGRMLRSTLAARSADTRSEIPPGMSKQTRAWRRQTVRVRSPMRSWRRSANKRSTAV